MLRRITYWLTILLLTLSIKILAEPTAEQVNVPILLYHRFGPIPGSTTITTAKFAEQLQWLHDNHFQVIPLRVLVNYLRGDGPPPPAKSVIITADDGHESVYHQMLPLVRKFNFPVTLFIYPSAISNASYALTWQQLRELQQTQLFDIQSHTFWHPDFNLEKKRMKPDDYQKFVDSQFSKAKSVLEKNLATKVDLLAWPFGIYNEELEQKASQDGYIMAFSIDHRKVNKSENVMAEPRYVIGNNLSIKGFANIINDITNQ